MTVRSRSVACASAAAKRSPSRRTPRSSLECRIRRSRRALSIKFCLLTKSPERSNACVTLERPEMSDESRAEKFLELFNKSREFTEELLRENERLRHRLGALEEENKDYQSRYSEIEEQNNNLASLYVASYQLHSTLDFREVKHVVHHINLHPFPTQPSAHPPLTKNTLE